MADAVIVGAGPNGLVAANLLADRGWHVVVLEAQAEPGGAVRSAELVEPGFVNDWCSSFYPLGASPAAPITRLELEREGLTWAHAPLVLAHPAADGTCALLSRDLDETAASFERHGKGDGQAWVQLHRDWSRWRDPLLELLFRPFPPVRPAARLAWRERHGLAELARLLVLPVRRLGEERFRGGPARRLLAGAALHADLAPEASLSGFYGLLLCMLAQDYGFPSPQGGAASLTAALMRRLHRVGGEVICNAPVRSIDVRDGTATGVHTADQLVPARRAVLADVDAVALYRRLLPEAVLPPGLLRQLDRFHRDHATLKVDWNLDGPIPWSAAAARAAGTVHLTPDVDHLTATEALLVQGIVPAHPFVIVGQMGVVDESRQPPGCATVWAYTHLPQQIRADEAGTIGPGPLTPAAGERLADRVEAEIEALAPGFRRLVRGRHVSRPSDLEAHDANLAGGAIAGGTAQLHQQLVFRPVPGRGRAETPVQRLYLASSSAHPGGGVHGAPGANAARAALLHARLDWRTKWR